MNMDATNQYRKLSVPQKMAGSSTSGFQLMGARDVTRPPLMYGAMRAPRATAEAQAPLGVGCFWGASSDQTAPPKSGEQEQWR